MDNEFDQNIREESQDNPFGMSVGDLMAALLLIFILLLSSTLLRLKNEQEKQNMVVTNYNEVKKNLYEDLYFTFKDDLTAWKAEIDSSSLTIRFTEPSMLFDNNQSILKPQFQQILKEFFPKYITVLSKPQFRENIEEIRIEGHTDSNGDYFYNMKLSQDRTRSVLEFAVEQLDETINYPWVLDRLTANGLSSSKLVRDKMGKEDRDASRRVEFRVRTNAETRIDEIFKIISE